MTRTFGQLIRATRKQPNRRFTMKRLGALCTTTKHAAGISESYISDIERGIRRPPSEDLVRKMAEILFLDADKLVEIAKTERTTEEIETLETRLHQLKDNE